MKNSFEKIDYLFYCLKKRGIYITIDLYCSRRIKQGELKEYPDITGRAVKTLSLVYPPARENWKLFARKLLKHKNKYTGLTWGEDPALYGVVLINEGMSYKKSIGNDSLSKILRKYYGIWLKDNKIKNTVASDSSNYSRFITEKQIEVVDEYRRFLREIGYKGFNIKCKPAPLYDTGTDTGKAGFC